MTALRAFASFVGAMPAAPKPGGKPGGPARSRARDITDEAIDKVIGDPQKRLEELAEWNVPQFSKEYKDDTPEIQFLHDMETGTRQAQEYIKYINDRLDEAQKLGSAANLDRIASVAGKLQKISGKLAGGLGKAGKVLKRAKELLTWLVALKKFADDSVNMDPKDRQSVKHWVGSMQRLWDASTPFAQWAQNKAAVAAIAESSAEAAAFSTVFVVVGSELFIGIRTLQAGVKVVDVYLSRLDAMMKEMDAAPAPAPPPEPGEWLSREEEAHQAVAREDATLRRNIRDAQRMEMQQEQEAQERSKETFTRDVFPPIYQSHRAEILGKVQAAVNQSESRTVEVPGEHARVIIPEDEWLDCFVEGGESAAEIDNFLALAGRHIKPCPFFDALYNAEFKKYMAKRG
jgi:hypothetical protein